MFRLQSFKKFLIVLFLFATLMVFVNTTVFSSFSSLKSTNQIHAATDNNDINYTRNLNEDTKLLHGLRFNQAKRFIRRPWPDKPDCSNFTIRRTVKHSLPPVALASYPGSGNTWVRYLIEAASGVYTGSIYKDANLYLQGFWGELADWDAGVTCAQKSHDSGSEHVRSFSGGRSIFLNRNPYEAILSFHNFLYGGHIGHAPSANFRRTEWPDFLVDQTRRWLGTAVNWTQYSTQLLTVHYEQLKEDPISQLRRILRFLQLPVDERRLACIKKYPQKKFHRKIPFSDERDEKKTVFPEQIRPIVDRAIRYVNYLSRRTGNPAVPLDNYSYYNLSGWKGSQPTQAQNQSWFEWASDQWGSRVVQSFLEDPLTKMLREEVESNSFYSWRIPFDSAYPESSQLELDFNSGPPEFIRRVRHKMTKRPSQQGIENKSNKSWK